jgi:hypothetical protein
MTIALKTFFLLLLMLVSGFAQAVVAGDEVLEEIVEQKYPLDPNAKFTLTNGDGSVRIYGADRPEMKLQAIKKAYTKDRLEKIDVSVAVQPGNVLINTKYPPKPKWGLSDRSGTVDYVIVLPWNCDVQQVDLGNGELLIEGMRGNEVHARLGNGRLFGHNCFTNLHLSIGSGGIDVAYDWWENHTIALDTTIREGNARVFIPSDAQFRLHAETANGHIFNDFSSKEDRIPGDRVKIDLSVGTEPNADLKLRALDGSINIKELYP